DLWCLRRGLLHPVMAKFLGPRFFLLVLAGVALCQESSSPSPTQTSSMPTDITTSAPEGSKSTSMQPTTLPTVISKTSELSSTQATGTKAAKTPGEGERSTYCNYSIKNGIDEIEVNIFTNRSTMAFTIHHSPFNSTEENITTPVSAGTPQKIPFNSFKPCQEYRVSVSPECNPETGTETDFKTTEFNVTHTVNTNDTHVEVCFHTKWNWNECITVDSNKSCTNLTVNAPCSKHQPFTFPPVKPVIKKTNGYPITFSWENKPSQCTNILTYSCKVQDLSSMAEGPLSAMTDLKPYHRYECSGTYNYVNGSITSDPIDVMIDCDVRNFTSFEATNSRIHAVGNLFSNSCKDLDNAFTWTLTCNNKSQHQGSCQGSSCKISHLEAYTKYICEFKAECGNKEFTSVSTVTTLPASPVFKKIPTMKPIQHNSFEMSCEIDNWKGTEGSVIALVYIGNYLERNETVKKLKPNGQDYLAEINNLRYLTDYTFKIYAENGNGNTTAIHELNYSTRYNDKAVLGILSFLIIITSLALLFVLYKIYLLKREKSRNEQELDDLLPTTPLLQVEPMSAEALLDAYKKKRADEGRLFMEEFQSIPRIFSNYTVREAKKPENQPKNRYVDILPYDYNRVPLSHCGTDDYINASFIEGYKESNKYIAAQGPKEETVGEFWTMIWEQKSSIIVMVTRCEEGNKNKCAQYWPSLDRETEIFDDLVVKIKGEETCPDYIIRHLTLMNRKEKSAEREVTHIQFTSWPDHGVPTDPGLLLKLRRRVNSFKNFFSGPIVIHCSAGVGRTGTYIGIDAMIESLEAEGRVDIYGYVVKLRRQRCLMVQVEAQYVLIHTALIEYSQFGETEMSLSNFHSEVNTLRQKDGNDPSLMEMEFQKLPKFKNYRSANTARSEENKSKNRSSIVPYDFNRVPIKVNDEASHDSEAEDEDEYSSDEEDEIPTKYINASYVDGYWSSGSFIAAQGPMPDTVVDFLHMLYQKRVKTVFMLTDCTENEKEFCSQYWSDEKKTFGELEVEVKETENCPTYVKRCLEIQHTKRKDRHTLQQYHFLKWAGHELPPKPLDLVDMMKKVREDIDTKNSDVPIVVHCNDGSSRSGVFCALWKLLDAADTEKLVDIFQVAKDLRKARLGVINSQ
ncbi:receptor-type tyrosine-protein phosphatase C isoform X4, partial [Clarias magur]